MTHFVIYPMVRLFIQENSPFVSVIAQLINPLLWILLGIFQLMLSCDNHIVKNPKAGQNMHFHKYVILKPPTVCF